MNKEKGYFWFLDLNCCSIHLYRQKKRTYTKELLGTRKVFAFLVFFFNIHKELFYKELAFRTFPNPRRILLCTSFRLLLDDGLARKQSK